MGWYCPRCGHQAGVVGTCPRDGEQLARVSTHDLHGRKLGEYKVLATLGGGSYGSVYRAVHERSGMLVAIKLLHRPIEDVESQRVIVEARAAAMLGHPNVVKVYDLAITADRRPYIVMQLLDGKSLSSLIRQGLSPNTAAAIANDVLAGLGAAHARGVLHRDLKPDNVFVTKGHALIVDFGLAKLVADPQSPALTATGEALGTPHYMAPEQVRGDYVDGRADLYAVGCVLFEMLAGRPPFEGTATYAIFDAHLHTPPPSVQKFRPDVPAALDATIARALAKDPNARFANAAEMQAALAGRAAPRGKPSRTAANVAAVSIAAVVATGVVLAVTLRSSDSTRLPTPSPSAEPDRPPGPRRVVVPAPLPDEPVLEPRLEDSLRSTADLLASGHAQRADVVAMRCALQTPSPAGLPAAVIAFNRRYLALLESAQPDLDYAKDCVKPPPTTPKPPRFSIPAPLPDEGAIDSTVEQVITTIHVQLEAGNLGMTGAREIHCGFVRQREEAIAGSGGLLRQVRGMHRRVRVLLEAYHPGVTKARCQ